MTEALTYRAGMLVVLGRVIGSGGEGTVYELPGVPSVVVKVYSEQARTPERAAKLEAMMAAPPRAVEQDQHKSIAWPIDLIHDSRGRVAGFAMPAAEDAIELSAVINPRSRARVARGMTWKHLVNIARNVAAVVEDIHAAGYVIGDLSERNFLVNREGLVTLIDCD